MMMGLLTTLLCSAFQAHAVLLSENKKAKVREEGKAEATTYDAFGCFCKSKTDEKTKAISEEEQTVSDLASEIKKLSSKRDQLDQDIQDLTEEIADHEHFLATAEGIRKEERAVFEASDLDLEKSVHQIDAAVKKLKAGSSFLQGKSAVAALKAVQESMQTALDMGDALGLIDAKSGLPALLQQPVADVPVADYTFHATSIIQTCEELLKAFRDKKVELETIEAKAQSDFERAMQSKAAQLKAAQEDVDAKNKKRTLTTEDIASAQADMTSTNAVLNDGRTYLKDLTAKCELKAKQWDQRSSMRASELTAITQALTVLKGSVTAQAEKVGEGGRPAAFAQEEEDDDDVSFVQKAAVTKATLRLVKKAAVAGPDSSEDVIRSQLIAIFKAASTKYKSPMLSTLALKVKEDPFVKIKGMIQKLLEEEADEANHKGYCDEEISKTVKDRDYRLEEIEALHASLEELNAREEKLALTKAELEEAVKSLSEDYTNQTAARAEEKEENKVTVEEAEEGVHAIKQALEILSHFYGEAAQATVEEGLIQQPSVEEDAPDAGFDE